MGQLFLILAVALAVGAVVFGVAVLVTGGGAGLEPAEPDGRAVPLPADRPLAESDVAGTRFDVTMRGYRMVQVDQAMRRAAYDIGYKDELISVLEAEITALRGGRTEDAEILRRARQASLAGTTESDLAGELTEDGLPEPEALFDLGELTRPAEHRAEHRAEHSAGPAEHSAEPAEPDEPDQSDEPDGPSDADADALSGRR